MGYYSSESIGTGQPELLIPSSCLLHVLSQKTSVIKEGWTIKEINAGYYDCVFLEQPSISVSQINWIPVMSLISTCIVHGGYILLSTYCVFFYGRPLHLIRR